MKWRWQQTHVFRITLLIEKSFFIGILLCPFCRNSIYKVDALQLFPEMSAGLIYKAIKAVVNQTCWNRLWKLHSIPCGNYLFLMKWKDVGGRASSDSTSCKDLSLCPSSLHACGCCISVVIKYFTVSKSNYWV